MVSKWPQQPLNGLKWPPRSTGHQKGLNDSLLMPYQWFTTSSGPKWSFFELCHPNNKRRIRTTIRRHWPALALQVKKEVINSLGRKWHEYPPGFWRLSKSLCFTKQPLSLSLSLFTFSQTCWKWRLGKKKNSGGNFFISGDEKLWQRFRRYTIRCCSFLPLYTKYSKVSI